MSTEVWFRNPHNYARELVECEAPLIAWDRGIIIKRRIEPLGWADLFFGSSIPVRQLIVSDMGTVEVGPGKPETDPIAVYPTWRYGDSIDMLEEMMASNIGDDPEACSDGEINVLERPVSGQEHRVVVANTPKANTGPGRAVLMKLKTLQEDYPDCILHIHGLYSFRMSFGLGFGAADCEPRTSAANGRVVIGSGVDMDYKHVQGHATWITAVGMKPADLEIPRMRCIFNIKSALWAGKHYNSLGSTFATTRRLPDYKVSEKEFKLPVKSPPIAPRIRKKKALEGDKTLCNMCSLQLDCKQFRPGQVCSLDEGNTGELAKFFKTRDSRTIIDGLSTLMAMQAHRLEHAAREESELNVLNPDVTRMVNALFQQGVTLAKLVDPSLRGGVKVNVGIVNGTATVGAVTSIQTPSELTGEVVRALELQGIPRDKITPELVMSTISAMGRPEDQQRAIEGAVIAEEGV